MADLFISYAREDATTAREIALALEAHGWSVWWDRDLIAGEDFDQAIERELRAAHAVLVVFSPNSVASRWVRSEASVAAELGTLIPVVTGGAHLPLPFRTIHAVELPAWGGEGAADAVHRIEEAIAAHSRHASSDPAWIQRASQSRQPDSRPAISSSAGQGQSSTTGAVRRMPLAGPFSSRLFLVATAAVAATVLGVGGYVLSSANGGVPSPDPEGTTTRPTASQSATAQPTAVPSEGPSQTIDGEEPAPALLAPVLVSPADSEVLHDYPRVTTLRWQRVAGAAEYEVEVLCDTCGSTPWQSWLKKTTTDTSLTFTWVGDNTARWRVTPVDASGGRGPASEDREFSFKTASAVPELTAPVLMSPADREVLHDYPRVTTVRWQRVAGAAEYEVEVLCDTCGSTPWQSWLKKTTTDTSLTFTWVGDNTARWQVTPVDASGNRGSTSSSWEFAFSTKP